MVMRWLTGQRPLHLTKLGNLSDSQDISLGLFADASVNDPCTLKLKGHLTLLISASLSKPGKK